MTLIIGFGHRARHGKDTAAEAVADYFNHWGYSAKHYHFAEALYKVCREEYGMVEKDAPLLQRVGNERRQGNPTYWIDKVMTRIADEKPDIAVISDPRYWNEGDAIKAAGGSMVKVERLNQDGTLYIAQDRPADHVSELQLQGFNFDYRITAKTGQAELVARHAITIVKDIREKAGY